ncbi:hypothetical protein GY45DRAFT_1039834 [Cubamyces sp. BRFM 1775]|nr:hypothetical protein GY45DRAFT_1039834 [Cubamyces sp. BRFM 1775]
MSSVPAITFRQLSRWSLVAAVRCCSPRQAGQMMYRRHLVLILLAPRRRDSDFWSGRSDDVRFPPMDASLFSCGMRGCGRVGMGVRACVRAEAVPSQLHHRPYELSFHPLRDPIHPSAVGHCLMTTCCLSPFPPFRLRGPASQPAALSPPLFPILVLPTCPPTALFGVRQPSRRGLSHTSFVSFLPLLHRRTSQYRIPPSPIPHPPHVS